MLKSSLYDQSDACILAKGAITITGRRENAAAANMQLGERNKGEIFKNCAPFTDGISEMNNTQDNVEDLKVIMPMYNLIEYSNNYW